MTLPFYKLHVAGNDFVLLDLARAGTSGDDFKAERLGELAQLILDRRCGVGGGSCIFVKAADGRVEARVFLNDGSETSHGRDSLLCAGRWALDTGRGGAGAVRIMRAGEEHLLRALDSKLFCMELPAPEAERLSLIVDGRTAGAYAMELGNRYSVAVASADGPGPKRVRMALMSMDAQATPLVVRPQGPELLRFTGPEKADRLDATAAAAVAAMDQGLFGREGIAEWRGRGGAVSYADFGSGTGRSTLIDRGRFYVERRGLKLLRISGTAEYAFEGNFDL